MPFNHSPKSLGEWVEVCFLERTTERGFTVSRPWGDNARYDFVVDSGSRLWRVQVRSSARPDAGVFRIATGSGAHKRPYTAREIDLLAALVVPRRVWYLIPIQEIVPRASIQLCPHRPSRRRWEKFRDNWSVFDTG